MKVRFACVLKLGGDYLPDHVKYLAQQVNRYSFLCDEFICYTDFPTEIPGVTTIPLEKGYQGWWSVPEIFRTVGPTVVMGLDTVIFKNIDELFKIAIDSRPEDFWMIRAFSRPDRTASGIMAWNGDWSWLWKKFNYDWAVQKFRGEQDYTNYSLRASGIKPKIIQDKFPGVYSWKKGCKNGIPNDTRIILFHGRPRPFEVIEIWEKVTGNSNLEENYG